MVLIKKGDDAYGRTVNTGNQVEMTIQNKRDKKTDCK